MRKKADALPLGFSVVLIIFYLVYIAFAQEDPLVTPLHIAAYRGDEIKVKNLLETGADVNAKDLQGLTPLHYAAQQGHTRIVILLLNSGADVNDKHYGGWTPLHSAATTGQKDVVKELIRRGADVNAQDLLKWTPLHNAVESGHAQVVELLLAGGADVNAEIYNGSTPLDMTAAGNNQQIADMLRKQGGVRGKRIDKNIYIEFGKPKTRKSEEEKTPKASVREPQNDKTNIKASSIHDLIEKLKDPDGKTRSTAVDQLAHLGEPALIPLIWSLEDESENVRSCAAIALGKIGDRRAVEPLITSLGDTDVFVRGGSALGLGMIGDQKAVEPLIGFLEHELVSLSQDSSEQHIQSARCAAKALEMITGKNYGFNYKEWKTWWNQKKSAP